jgi:peptidoglycan/LPS O-acetylase OafA/YrhL
MLRRLTFLLLALLLLGSARIAQAQQVPPTPYTAAQAPDTVAALHRLFAAKRKKLLPIVAGTVAASTAGVVIVGSTVDSGGFIDDRAVGQALSVIVGVAAVSAEVLFYSIAYGKTKEQRAVAAFEAHQLPRHLKRQLKAKYFQ